MRGWFWVVLAVIAIAFLAGALLTYRAQDDPQRWAAAEATRAQTAEQQRWAQVSEPVRLALLALGGGGAICLGIYAGFRLVERRSRVIYPNRDGVPPVVVLRPGEVLVDAGSLAGPLVMTATGPEYRLPEGAIPQLQAGANQGAAMTRTMRAWATHLPGSRAAAAPPALPAPEPEGYPPIEVLATDEAHIYRLLEESPE